MTDRGRILVQIWKFYLFITFYLAGGLLHDRTASSSLQLEKMVLSLITKTITHEILEIFSHQIINLIA